LRDDKQSRYDEQITTLTLKAGAGIVFLARHPRLRCFGTAATVSLFSTWVDPTQDEATWHLRTITFEAAFVILKAFFDTSTRVKSGIFCIAGYAFSKLQLQKFDADWTRLFGKYRGCHMKELVHCEGRFRGIERAEADRLLKEAVRILRKRTSYGAVVSCNLNEMHSLLPRWIHGFEHAYPVCCHLVMATLANAITESGEAHRVDYVFEEGDAYSGCARDFMENTYDCPELKESYRHASHAFLEKSDALALQAADLLAWEWAKFMDESMYQRVRPMRLSLANLMNRHDTFDPTIYKVAHLQGESLRRFMQQVHGLGLLELRERQGAKRSAA
jgi:hypothetical protein